eukprot:23665_1
MSTEFESDDELSAFESDEESHAYSHSDTNEPAPVSLSAVSLEFDKSADEETPVMPAWSVAKLKRVATLVRVCNNHAGLTFPKPRSFELSEDGQALLWYSKHKRLAETTVALSQVSGIDIGQDASVFDRLPRYFQTAGMKRQSFVVKYSNENSRKRNFCI